MTKSYYLIRQVCLVTSFLITIFVSCSIVSVLAQTPNKLLHLYNWSDYIGPTTLSDFEAKTDIKVIYDVYDSNEMLDGKLMAGNTGFDIVVPSDIFLARQRHYSIYQPIDKKRLRNYNNLDPTLLKLMQTYDPGNRYGIPYMWQTTGIGVNTTKIKQLLGNEVSLNSWDLVFDVNKIRKLHQCGVAFLDAPLEIYPIVLNYLGKDPNNASVKDYDEATQLLMKIRPYITYFHSSKYMSDLASGDICVAIAWSGDVFQTKRVAEKAHNPFDIDYILPKEGALISFDLLTIPKNPRNIDETYQFIDYLLEPDVIAKISNHIFFPNANLKSLPYIDKALTNNQSIYPTDTIVKQRLFPVTELPPDKDRYLVRMWTKVLTGY